MICPKCGAENPEGTNFCGNCAASLNESTPPPVQPASSEYSQMSPPGYEAQMPQKKPIWPWIIVGVFVLGICGCGVLAAVLFPVFSQAKVAAKKSIAVSNAKQVGTAMAIYQADFDDMFPPFSSSQDVASRLAPYLKPSSSTFETTSSPVEWSTVVSGYVWNQELSEKSVTGIADISGWMFYDPIKQQDKVIVGHIDTSVRAETDAEFEATKAKKLF